MEEQSKETEDNPTTSESSQTKTEFLTKDSKLETPASRDAELDITSELFNPLKALYATDYRVTEREPKIIYQNMAAFETAFKKVGILGLNKKPKNLQASGSKKAFLVEEESQQRRFQEHQMAVRTQTKVKSKHRRNLLMQMAQAEGPLQQLQQFIKEGQIVKVLIRREHGIKGYVEGILKMFDRHWNLLLVNVVECLEQRKYKYADDKLIVHQASQDCSYLLEKLGIRLPLPTVKSLSRKRVEIKRQLPQLLIRGEHVVLVSAKSSA